MEDIIAGLICCPHCRGELTYDQDEEAGIGAGITCNGCGRNYDCSDGYPSFINGTALLYRSRRDKFIRSVYVRTYTPVTNFMFLFCGGAASARNEVLSRLKLKPGAYVLETGMGYGENFLWLKRHVEDLNLFGLDIQVEMMANCRRNLNRWGITAGIVRADAVRVPFRDDSFDVVFHLGAINLFSDKKRAIEEMIRVAKPGTHIVIADETEKAGKLFNLFTGPADRIIPPVDLIPESMENITMETIWRGFGYVIEFDTV
jgi:SAM-dependent methyltransferase